jgi:hypothetical protein
MLKNLLLCLASLIVGIGFAPRADAAVYWGDGWPIGVANLDGSFPGVRLLSGLGKGTCMRRCSKRGLPLLGGWIEDWPNRSE